jgi:hypothetical protein
MKKQTKEQKILALLAKGKSVKEILKQVGGKAPYIYYVRWKSENKNTSKKKATFKSPRSRLIQDVFQMKKALDVIEKKPDLVNKPPHYTDGGVDTLTFIEAKDLNYRLGNVIKYVSRCGKKLDSDPLQDLMKARFYLQREIDVRREA